MTTNGVVSILFVDLLMNLHSIVSECADDASDTSSSSEEDQVQQRNGFTLLRVSLCFMCHVRALSVTPVPCPSRPCLVRVRKQSYAMSRVYTGCHVTPYNTCTAFVVCFLYTMYMYVKGMFRVCCVCSLYTMCVDSMCWTVCNRCCCASSS